MNVWVGNWLAKTFTDGFEIEELKALRDTINAVDQYGSPSGAYDQARFNAIDLLTRFK